MKKKIHATSIISGYRLACKESTKYIKQTLSLSSENLANSALINIAKTSIASKIIGAEAEFFASLCVKAISRVKTVNNKGKARYPVASVNVLKCHGKSMKESEFVEGFALNCTVTSQGLFLFLLLLLFFIFLFVFYFYFLFFFILLFLLFIY